MKYSGIDSETCYSGFKDWTHLPPPEKYSCFEVLLPSKNELTAAVKMLLTAAIYIPGLLPGHAPGTADPRPISFAFLP